MKLRSIATFLVVALASAAAHAQAGVYVTFDAQRFSQSGIRPNPLPGSGNNDSPWLFGPTYGVYYDVTRLPRFGVLHTGPVLVGIDARGDTFRGSDYGQYDRQDGIFSLRVSAKKTFMSSTPYIQGGFGIGHTRIPTRTTYNNNFVYQFGFGADRKLRGRLDWRVIEATTGFLGNYPVGAGPNQANYLVTLGTGLVVRLNKESPTK